MNALVLNSSSAALFTLSSFDISPITDTIKANAPMIITAGVTITLTMVAINFIPKLIKRNVKG